MLKHHDIFKLLAILSVSAFASSCADRSSTTRPRPQLTSCPPGFVLVCESRQEPSKGGAEEEIPQYEYCRCEQAY